MPVTRFEIEWGETRTQAIFEHSCSLGEFLHRLLKAYNDSVKVRVGRKEEFSPADIFFDILESLKQYRSTSWQTLDILDLVLALPSESQITDTIKANVEARLKREKKERTLDAQD